MHEEGQIPKSQDVGTALVVMAASAAIGYSFESIGRALAAFSRRMFRLEDGSQPLLAMHAQVDVLIPVFIPLIVASLAAAIAGGAQARTFSFALLMPKPARFNPVPALMQMLPGKDGLMEVSKQIVKLLAVGYIAYAVVRDALPAFTMLSSAAPLVAAQIVADVASKLVIRVSAALVVVAVLDYYLVHRKFVREAMMSREEVRDEHKQEEGRPEIRARIRAKMREMSKNRSVSDVAKATVLVVNPTHYAVALRYSPERDLAPIVLSKGKDEVALAMRTMARHERVPIVEQPPLARALHASAKLGRPIPIELYRAVAEVIAYVMQLRARDAGRVFAHPGSAEPSGPAAVGGETADGDPEAGDA